MAYIKRDKTLWEEFEPAEAPALANVKLFLDVLSRWDKYLIQELERDRGPRGRNDYPVRAMWNAIAVMMFLRHKTFSSLLSEIVRNEAMAYILGFNVRGGRLRVPQKHVFSRFHKKLQGKMHLIQKIMDKTVLELKGIIPGIGEKVAVDSTNIRTHARPPSKARPGRDAGVSADSEATWSVKTKEEQLPTGATIERTEATFGYKPMWRSTSTMRLFLPYTRRRALPLM